jgi:hypothetical protein
MQCHTFPCVLHIAKEHFPSLCILGYENLFLMEKTLARVTFLFIVLLIV